jgi:type III restriction enzyme
VVGVINRSTPDSIALVEIKDDGVTGRLQADLNIMKIRVQHQEYKNAFGPTAPSTTCGLVPVMMKA